MSEFLDKLIVSPLPDGVQWCVENEHGFRYHSDLAGEVVVPFHYLTDFASIPSVLWSVLPVWQRYGSAAVLHDSLYFFQTLSRDVADSVLREAMLLLGVSEPIVNQIYEGVHLFGQRAWDRDRALRDSGYSRIASMIDQPPYAGI